MTTPTRAAMREALARAMGWQFKVNPLLGKGKVWHGLDGYPANLFNPFTNAADKDKLVKWLAADDARWKEFKQELLSDWASSLEQDVVRFVLTSPPETISLAAWRAIQEQPKC